MTSLTVPPDLRAVLFKPGVDWRGVKSITWDAVMAASEICQARGVACVVTSMADDAPGRKPNSLHKIGLAFDLRVTHIAKVADRLALVDALRSRLGEAYDVVLHSVDAASAEHIHVEYDPPAPKRKG